MRVMDWMLTKIQLTEEEREEIDWEAEGEEAVANFYESLLPSYKKREIVSKKNNRVYYKDIKSYDDCKVLINQCKQGDSCVYRIETAENTDAQGMMNYICGAVYAMEGEVKAAGGNVFWVCEKGEVTNR